jgi:putative FmdB family regulatory protein
MPIYEFECKKCKKEYDALASYDESGMYKDVECPHCGSKSKNKLVSCCNHTFTNPEGTGKWENSQTGHDYRFKHNLPKVLAEREAAERAQLGLTDGNQPYQDFDDANKFGEGIHDPETRGGLA